MSTEERDEMRELADGLNARIEHFQRMLGARPDRMRIELWWDNPDGEHLGLMLKKKAGNLWTLFACLTGQKFKERSLETPWTALADAPLRVKMFAILKFPEFVSEMTKHHKAVLADLRNVISQFDQTWGYQTTEEEPK